MTREEVVEVWAAFGVAIDPATIEDVGLYSPHLVLGDVDPKMAIDRLAEGLGASGFRKLSRKRYGELGVLPRLMAIPGTASTAQERSGEIVVAYARRAGLPLGDGTLPCRVALSLVSTRLLGAWAGRGLEGCGVVKSAEDQRLVVEGSAAFDAVTQALVRTGARVIESVEARREVSLEHVRASMRRAGLEPDSKALAASVVSRETVLLDRDGRTVTLTETGDGVTVVRDGEP